MPELVAADPYSSAEYEAKNESHVLVLYLGGTIGMVHNDSGVYSVAPNALVKLLRSDPRLHDESYVIKRKKQLANDDRHTKLVLPMIRKMKRVIYTVREYEKLIDSCDVTPVHWKQIAEDIYDNYTFYDGFVILHGTDTLSYTASVLSFMFENLGKTVVVTGSQIPMCDARSDGSENFIGSLIFAGNYTIPEVTVYFCNKLMRGNRTIKFSSSNLDPFASPNAREIARMGTEIVVNYNEIQRPSSLDKFTIHTQLAVNVGLLRIFPNIPMSLVKTFLRSDLKGIVLQTFGCGNLTATREDLINELRSAVDRGVFIVNCTQCYNGNVVETYETGKILNNVGVISGADMTSEAALNKLAYVLSKTDWDDETKKQMLRSNLRGELTSPADSFRKTEISFTKKLKEALHGFNVGAEIENFDDSILTTLIMNAVKKEDFEHLQMLHSLGANFNIPNEDGRTPLHLACRSGNVELVRLLLNYGCILHAKDNNNKTPLAEAILCDHHNVIEFLRSCGAHVANNAEYVGENLCRAAFRGMVTRLKSYQLAGVDLNAVDYSGRSPLHAAVVRNNVESVKFLLENKVSLKKDHFGETALDYAVRLKLTEMSTLMSTYQGQLEVAMC